MKNISLPALAIGILFSGVTAFAQEKSQAGANSSPTAKTAPEPVTIDGYVYVDQLPTPTQLVREAEREQLVVKRMDRSPGRIVVVYEYPDGRTRAFAYTVTSAQVPAATATEIVRPATPAPAVVYVEPAPSTTTTVVYREPERVYIYEEPYYRRRYEPVRDFWAPLTVGIGLGWGFGHGGHYHHHHHGHHGRGGWRR